VERYKPLSDCEFNKEALKTPKLDQSNKWQQLESNKSGPTFNLLKTNYKGNVDPNAITTVTNFKLFSEYSDFDDKNYWTKDYERPQNLLFWFDFIDVEGYNEYSCKEIGTRPIVKKESSVGAISYNPSPAVYYDESF
jgi:hypothetical protein